MRGANDGRERDPLSFALRETPFGGLAIPFQGEAFGGEPILQQLMESRRVELRLAANTHADSRNRNARSRGRLLCIKALMP